MEKKEIRFTASRSSGDVNAILLRPVDAQWLLVYAHGAGAPMRHPFMESTAYLNIQMQKTPEAYPQNSLQPLFPPFPL